MEKHDWKSTPYTSKEGILCKGSVFTGPPPVLTMTLMDRKIWKDICSKAWIVNDAKICTNMRDLIDKEITESCTQFGLIGPDTVNIELIKTSFITVLVDYILNSII